MEVDHLFDVFASVATEIRAGVIRWARNNSDLSIDAIEDAYSNAVRSCLSRLENNPNKEISNMGGYLFSSFRRELIAASMVSRHFVEIEDKHESIADHCSISSIEAKIMLEEFLHNLNANDAQLVNLLRAGYRSDVISVKLGISNMAVRQRISRLRKKFHQFFERTPK